VSPRRAAFLDRDGTIIEDVNYIARAEDVRLLPGAADAVRLLNEHDVTVVVITNQSGIARGLVTPAQYESVRRRIDDVLAAGGARLDATYYCPHYPDVTGPCECRKPGALLYDRAIADLDLDAAASLFAGDLPRDVLPAARYGGSAYLIRSASAPPDDAALYAGAAIVGSLLEAVQLYLAAHAPRT
jgi:D-glycero-D-manno-heptose 1,7-bisphosphate phosphatase